MSRAGGFGFESEPGAAALDPRQVGLMLVRGAQQPEAPQAATPADTQAVPGVTPQSVAAAMGARPSAADRQGDAFHQLVNSQDEAPVAQGRDAPVEMPLELDVDDSAIHAMVMDMADQVTGGRNRKRPPSTSEGSLNMLRRAGMSTEEMFLLRQAGVL